MDTDVLVDDDEFDYDKYVKTHMSEYDEYVGKHLLIILTYVRHTGEQFTIPTDMSAL